MNRTPNDTHAFVIGVGFTLIACSLLLSGVLYVDPQHAQRLLFGYMLIGCGILIIGTLLH